MDVRSIDLLRSRWDVLAPRRIARLVRDVEPDLLHLHGTRAGFFAALARRLAGSFPRIVYTVHGLAYRQDVGPLRKRLLTSAERAACSNADAVIGVSRADVRDIVSRFVPVDRTTYIPNGIDTRRFAPGDKLRARHALGLPEREPLVCTVARLVKQKSVDVAIRAAGSAGVGIVIAGDGPERGRLESLADTLGVCAFFLGERTDIPTVLTASDLFVLSSRWEGEPLALLEAMAVGRPCVATDTVGARELLGEWSEEQDVLVPIGDLPQLGKAIRDILGDPMTQERLREFGRRRARRRSVEAMGSKTFDVYAALVAREQI